MTIYQALLVSTLISIAFFVSETYQMVFKTDHQSNVRWNWSVGILILVTVLVRIIDGEWWFSAILPAAFRGLTIIIGCVALFAVFTWVMIVSGDFIIKMYGLLRKRMTRGAHR